MTLMKPTRCVPLPDTASLVMKSSGDCDITVYTSTNCVAKNFKSWKSKKKPVVVDDTRLRDGSMKVTCQVSSSLFKSELIK
jgi:hypothetical protein